MKIDVGVTVIVVKNEQLNTYDTAIVEDMYANVFLSVKFADDFNDIGFKRFEGDAKHVQDWAADNGFTYIETRKAITIDI